VTAVPGPGLVDAFLAHHLRFRPIDATFMGIAGYDDLLPPAGAGTASEEKAGLDELQARLAALAMPATPGARHDLRLMRAEVAVAQANLAHRPRFANPCWYTGEAAFAIIGLLLPQSRPVDPQAVAARLGAIPDFLSDGQARLEGIAAPRGWVERAKREAAGFAEFLDGDLRRHPDWSPAWAGPADAAARSARAFAAAIDGLEDRDPAAGLAHLSLLIREAHGLDLSPEALVRRAEAAFERNGAELTEMAAEIDPRRSWREQLEDLATLHLPTAEAVPESYRAWHDRAMTEGAALVTPATGYGLAYRFLPPAFRRLAKDLYFLFYRSPPARRPGAGSLYWVAPPGEDEAAYLRQQNHATVKAVHAVHHGSIGHHTQNARAREAPSRLARLGGTDCAAGIAFLSAGTMVEGWACYAEDLLMEAADFYTPAERLLLKHFERRNAASVLVDVRLHAGEWSLDEARRFYREEAGFAPARVDGEVTRNSIFPASRLMYWTGVEGIKALRSRWRGDTRAFHDELIGHGHVPVAWVESEMRLAGKIA
jgi:Bacterial protein of unknown function (DUF885)